MPPFCVLLRPFQANGKQQGFLQAAMNMASNEGIIRRRNSFKIRQTHFWLRKL
jgi:hypothetical protein